MTIIRSHEPIIEGYEAKESFITVFSCSDYGGQGNKASILSINKSEELVPKLLLSNPSSSKDRWVNLEESRAWKNVQQEDQTLRKLNFTPPKR